MSELEKKEIEQTVNSEKKEVEVKEGISPCTKKICRLNREELTELRKKHDVLDRNYLREINKRIILLKETIKFARILYGKRELESILKDIEREELEAYQKLPKLKDDKGNEIKCSDCQKPIVYNKEWKVNIDTFKASDDKYYCLDCYNKKYPVELDEKMKLLVKGSESEKSEVGEKDIKNE